MEQHAQTKFSLDGAHVATPCFACHLKEDKWRFRNIGERCVDCHEDIHKKGGEIAETWYPNQDCQTCHLTEAWSASSGRFDHSKTKFQLKGKHQTVDCRGCHVSDDEPPKRIFAGLPATCANCHTDSHAGQFIVDGTTDCARCHGFDGWAMKQFNHDKTRFPLEGKHATTACEKCHLAKEMDGQMVVQYKMASFECVDCHK